MTALTVTCSFGADAPLETIGALRRAAWGPLIGDDRADERFGIEDEDRIAWHLFISKRDRLVAAGRLAVREHIVELPESHSFASWATAMTPPVGFASRLSVRPENQAAGLGERIIEGRLAIARQFGLTQVWGETRTGHIHGLERYGYRLLGESTYDSVPGGWHIMCAPLTDQGAAALDI